MAGQQIWQRQARAKAALPNVTEGPLGEMLADHAVRDALEAAEARAEQAEAERDILAEYIVEITEACPRTAHSYSIDPSCDDCEETKPYAPCWIEYAKQKAQKAGQ